MGMNPLGMTLAMSVNNHLARKSQIEGLSVERHVSLQLLPVGAGREGEFIAQLHVKWNNIELKKGLASNLRPAIHRFVANLEGLDVSGFKVVPQWGDYQFGRDLDLAKDGDDFIKAGKYRRWVAFEAASEDALISAFSKVLTAPDEPRRNVAGRAAREKGAGLIESHPV